MPTPMNFEIVRARLETDLDLAHKFVHGTDTESIVVESGTIPTLANMAKNLPLSEQLRTVSDMAVAVQTAITQANATLTSVQAAKTDVIGHKNTAQAAMNAATEAMALVQAKASEVQLAALQVGTASALVTQTLASTQAARDQANLAALSAASYGYALSANSTTSNTVSIGTKAFSIGTGKQFLPKQWVIATSGNNYVAGEIQSYIDGTLTVVVTKTSGEGTHSDWVIGISGPAGQAGVVGPAGPQGPQGVNGAVRTYLDKGTLSSGSAVFDFSAAQHQRLQVAGALTLAVSNWPVAGGSSSLLLELVNGGAFALTWPTINWVLSDGTITQTFSLNGSPLLATGTDFVMLWTRDGGATVYGKVVR